MCVCHIWDDVSVTLTHRCWSSVAIMAADANTKINNNSVISITLSLPCRTQTHWQSKGILLFPGTCTCVCECVCKHYLIKHVSYQWIGFVYYWGAVFCYILLGSLIISSKYKMSSLTHWLASYNILRFQGLSRLEPFNLFMFLSYENNDDSLSTLLF